MQLADVYYENFEGIFFSILHLKFNLSALKLLFAKLFSPGKLLILLKVLMLFWYHIYEKFSRKIDVLIFFILKSQVNCTSIRKHLFSDLDIFNCNFFIQYKSVALRWSIKSSQTNNFWSSKKFEKPPSWSKIVLKLLFVTSAILVDATSNKDGCEPDKKHS